SAICPGIIDTPIVSTGIVRGEIADIQGRASSYYAKHGASPDEVAQAILATIARPRLVVPVPRRHVTVPYLLHRISPRLVQPLARSFERIVTRGCREEIDHERPGRDHNRSGQRRRAALRHRAAAATSPDAPRPGGRRRRAARGVLPAR